MSLYCMPASVPGVLITTLEAASTIVTTLQMGKLRHGEVQLMSDRAGVWIQAGWHWPIFQLHHTAFQGVWPLTLA